MDKLRRIIKLFLVFSRIGAFTFGGGYAMIPLIQKEIVENNQWIEEEEVMDVFAVVQSVPGAIAINTSVFVGYKVAGIMGALASVFGLVLPSFIIIAVIATFLYGFKDIGVIARAFEGVRAGVVALIVLAVEKLAKPGVKGKFGITLAVISFLLVSFTSISAVYILLGAALTGYIAKKYFVNDSNGENKGSL